MSTDPTTRVLPRCARALANQGGCRHKWNEILLALCLDASAPGPRPHSGCVESIGDCLYSFQSQHECAVAPGCWTHPCASCPRKTWLIGDCLKQACSIGDCRTMRGPPIGWTEIFGPAGIRPGTLRACTPAGRQEDEYWNKPTTTTWAAEFLLREGESKEFLGSWIRSGAVPEAKKRRVKQVITCSFPSGQWLHMIGARASPRCELVGGRERHEGHQ